MFGLKSEEVARGGDAITMRVTMTESATVVADGGGLRKPDLDKIARFDLLPPEPMWALAVCMGRNLEENGGKYPERNWERGMAFRHCFGAILRHAWKWWWGETYDEHGTHHMIAVMWNAMALFAYEQRGHGTDDRPRKAAGSISAVCKETLDRMAAQKTAAAPRYTDAKE